MKRIVVATNNKGKIEEIKQILSEYDLVTLNDINCNIEVDEDADTFEANSLKKAREIYKVTGMPCIADDSGLCIDEFNGWPGVYSARFLGENATQEERNNAILERMSNLEKKQRIARFVCVITYYDGENIIVGKGETVGIITNEPRGNDGFGFDPLFEVESGKTYAELGKDEKNKISHRKRALENLKKQLTNM